MDFLVKLLVAIIGYILASFGIKKLTGKHIHAHVYDWYSRFRDKAAAWLRQHPEMKGAQFLLTFLVGTDEIVNTALRMKDFMREKSINGIGHAGSALSKAGNFIVVLSASLKGKKAVITEEEVSPEELAKMFPEMRNAVIGKPTPITLSL